ncbi:MAG: hypothetical protein KatS3mg079_656 [Caloramator sp.]|nr:MAG: hypothetical protein KatS3mg079_656 [Caloramator sp.]
MTIYVKSKTYKEALRFVELLNERYVTMIEIEKKTGITETTIRKWLTKMKKQNKLDVRYKRVKNFKIAEYKAKEKIEIEIQEQNTRLEEARKIGKEMAIKIKNSKKIIKDFLKDKQAIKRNELIDYAADLNYQGSCKELIRMAEEMGVKVVC